MFVYVYVYMCICVYLYNKKNTVSRHGALNKGSLNKGCK